MKLLTRILFLGLCLPLFHCGDDDGGSGKNDGGTTSDGQPGSDGSTNDGNTVDGNAFSCEPISGTTLALQPVASDLNKPVFVTSPPGDSRLFVVEKTGTIRIVKNGQVSETPFLDLTSKIVVSNEQGLLGLAFHPDYASNGRFFVYYTAKTSIDNTVAEYTVSRDPDVADTTEKIVLAIEDFASNHNGGMITFGKDGYLYIGTGDGGSAGDPMLTGQNLTQLLGKILRIDIDGGGEQPYAIPADNPFAISNLGVASPRGEIWLYGLRNPWRYSFDRLTGDMWIGDVGQDEWEEVNHVPSGEKGLNFGWSDKEGEDCYNKNPCSGDYVDPVFQYVHDDAAFQGFRSITGGYVYRGECFPDIEGWYFFTDYVTGEVWAADVDAETFNPQAVSFGDSTLDGTSSFGEDVNGEIYVVGHGSGTVHRLVVAP